MELSNFENTKKIAIVVVGYNRLGGLKRLLNSLTSAYYPVADVPLIISIDCSGNQSIYDYVKDFKWIHGTKYVNIQKERLGLKKHILQCGNYSQYFRGVILLEDDLYVSNDFYNYTLKAFDTYDNNEKVAGISLYSPELNGYIGLPFQPLHSGYDVYAWQSVSSWGEAWSSKMWSDFQNWLNQWDDNFDQLLMPSPIKAWTKAWSKYYYAYILKTNKYFIYPYVSLTTNFNDAGGEHTGGDSSFVQVSLREGCCDYRMPKFCNLVCYDVFQQNTAIYNILGIKENELCIDLYGMTFDNIPPRKYLLSIKKYDYKIIRTYALSLRPIELNVLHNIDGEGIYLYDTTAEERKSYASYSVDCISYFIKGFNKKLAIKYIIAYYKKVLMRKLHIL